MDYAMAQRLGEEGKTVLISRSRKENVEEAVKKLKKKWETQSLSPLWRNDQPSEALKKDKF